MHELVQDDHFRTIVENHNGSSQCGDLNSLKFQDLLKVLPLPTRLVRHILRQAKDSVCEL